MASCSPLLRSLRNFLWCVLTLAVSGNLSAQTAPSAPTGFSMPKMTYFNSSTQVWRLQWTDNSTNENGFQIYFRYGGIGPVTLYDEVVLAGTLTNVTTTSGSTTVTCASTANLGSGWTVTGTNIPANTVIASVTNATTFELSTPATGSGSALTLPWESPYKGASGYTYAMNIGVNAAAFANFQMEWWVVAYNGAGSSGASNSATFSSWPGSAGIAVPPAAPSGLTVTPSGDGQFHISFSDNSNSEQYFELAFKKTADSTWTSTGIDFGTPSSDVGGYQTFGTTLNSVNTVVYLPNFQPGTSYDFMIRAVDWGGNASAFTSVVSATTQAFKAPTGLTATRVGENTFDLSFTNNSTADSGYEFQFREQGSSTWLQLGVIDNPYFSIINTGPLNPNTTYEFQVRAYIRTTDTNTNPVSYPQTTYSSFSNTATASSIFTAPTNLVASSPSEGRISLTWTDNSSIEGNYEVQVRFQGDTNWQSYDYLAADATSLANQLIAPGATLEFRVRATRGASAEYTSAFSNTVSITSAFNAPTALTATASATEPYRISFEWTDNSGVETEYELQARKLGGTFTSRKVISANGGSAPNTMNLADLPEFDPGSIYEFQIRARYAPSGSVLSTSAFSSIATTTTLDGFSSKPYAPITMGTPFSYQLATMSQATRTGWSVGTLPEGLLFDSVTGIISGTPTVAGLFSVPMTANFSGGGSHVLNLALRILRPPAAPAVVEVIADQSLTPGGNSSINLAGKFSDLDTESAVRVSTNAGNVDVILYPTLTPGTVTNFLSYDYTNVIFHRAPAGFVVQGGGYKVYEAPDVFESISRQTAITNEPGISNVAGTVAMAKLGDDPNSATSEFFFSLGNNSANLDNQNGGFTVFGRVSNASSTALAALGNVPTSSYAVKLRTNNVTPASANFSFSDIPINESPVPTTINQSSLVKINSVTPVAVLTYAITTDPDGTVATAVMNGTNLEITAVAPGSTSLVVSATDVDGNSTPQTININVTRLPATITLENLTQTYDGTPRAVTATTNPTGLQVDFTYGDPPSATAPTDHGTYAVNAVINDATYTGSQTGTLLVRGMPFSDWRTLKFSQAQIDGGLAADDADADGDGIKNFIEYALGSDPNDPGDPPTGLTPVRDGNGLTITFTRPKDLPDVLYGAESTDSFTSWDALTVELITDGPLQTLRVRDPLTSGNPDRRFIHLIFNRPPP